MVLLQLKKSFNNYELLWDLWKARNDINGLTLIDVKIIDVYRDSNFYLKEQLLRSFYSDFEVINYLLSPIALRLDANYNSYMSWVIKVFHFYLISLVDKTEIEQVKEISKLNINNTLKFKLSSFGVKTIDDLIEYTEFNIENLKVFNEVLKFKSEISHYETSRLHGIKQNLKAANSIAISRGGEHQ